MPQPDSIERDTEGKMAGSYRQLGLQPGASMREIETAYWMFARELRGQSTMAPYTRAYEALVNSVRSPQNDVPGGPAAAPDPVQEDTLAVRPPSKFGWPDR